MYPKADLIRRFVAYLIDSVVAFIVSVVPIIGPIVGATYILLRDGFDFGFMRYKSLGKSIMKLEVVAFNKENKQSDFKVSLNRNWILALPTIVAIIPVIGIIIGGFISIIVVLLEGIKTIVDANGRRFGDAFANSQVVFVDDLKKQQNNSTIPVDTPPAV